MKPWEIVKPRLIFFRGYWWCGIYERGRTWSACAETPQAAYRLWERSL